MPNVNSTDLKHYKVTLDEIECLKYQYKSAKAKTSNGSNI